MSRDDYIRNLYGGSSTSSSDTSAPNYPGNQTYTSTGTPNFGSNVNTTSGVGTNVSGIADKEEYKFIKDPKLDEDVGVYEANQDLFDTLKDTYTSPTDTYASDLNFVTVDPETVQKLGLLEKLKDKYAISDETLKFYGVDPANPATLPIELYQMIAEGSIVTPMEAMQSGESNIGTFSDLEAGVHPLLGSIDKYYGIMSGSSFPQPATGGGGGSITPGGGSSYGAYLGAGMPMSPKQLGDAEKVPGQLRLLQYMVNVHRGNPYTKMAMRKKDGGLASIVGD